MTVKQFANEITNASFALKELGVNNLKKDSVEDYASALGTLDESYANQSIQQIGFNGLTKQYVV